MCVLETGERGGVISHCACRDKLLTTLHTIMYSDLLGAELLLPLCSKCRLRFWFELK